MDVETIEIKAEYIQQIFYADDSNYAIIRVILLETTADFDKGESLTVTGTFHHLELNHQYVFEGKIVEHPKYGFQFQAVSSYELLPQEKENIIRYLKNLNIKGIGQKTIERLYDTYGENMLEVFSQAEGDTSVFFGFQAKNWDETKAQALLDAIAEQQSQQLYFFRLIKMGLASNLVVQLQERYTTHLQEIIETNSYQILDDFDGINIKVIDGFVTKYFPEQVKYRLGHAIVYHMKAYCYQSGSSAMLQSEIVEVLQKDYLQNYQEAEIFDALHVLLDKKKVYEIDSFYMLDYFYLTEQLIVQNIQGLIDKQALLVHDETAIFYYIKQCEQKFGITYATQQKEAIAAALTHPIFLMTGGPGTGKTTIIRAILETYLSLQQDEEDAVEEKDTLKKIALLAPTGRAAQRMQDATGIPARTIHSFLGWDLHSNSYRFNEFNPIADVEFVIVDETSMVDMWLLASLFKALPNLQQIIFVGDADQLPSVSIGQCFQDMLESEIIAKIRMQEIFRQKHNSTIIDVSNNINEGKLTDMYFTQSADYSFIEMQPLHLLSAVEKIYLNALNKGYDMFQIQILAPLYKGKIGIDTINRHIQSIVNPDNYAEDERFITANQVVFLPNDKVIQLKNMPDYDVYNGDMGKILSIEHYGKDEYDVLIDFNGKELIYSKDEMKLLRHAYCISIHKAQGSEFQVVIMPIFYKYTIMLYRKLLYTGTSRAKKALIILGQKQALLQAIDNNRELQRRTLLAYFLAADNYQEPKTIVEAIKYNIIGEDLGGITPWDFLH